MEKNKHVLLSSVVVTLDMYFTSVTCLEEWFLFEIMFNQAAIIISRVK